jgi:hypothetical protein
MPGPDPREDLFRLLGLMEKTAETFLNERALIEEHRGDAGDLRAILMGHYRAAEAIQKAVQRTLAKYGH